MGVGDTKTIAILVRIIISVFVTSKNEKYLKYFIL